MNKSESKAKAEADRVEAKEDKEAVMLELEQLANYKAELHSSCDLGVPSTSYQVARRIRSPSRVASCLQSSISGP